MPLVLVQNEVIANSAYNWDDVEGVHYHYPSKYRNKVVEGERFAYYVGVHRADGKRRPHGEYFGTGTIGQIWPDPERPNSWYCSIEDYERFSSAVPAKIDGKNIEVGKSNMWRDGVRVIDKPTFERILSLAARTDDHFDKHEQGSDPSTAQIAEAELIVPPAKRPPLRGRNPTTGRSSRGSRRAKEIGDWGEAIAVRFINEMIPRTSNLMHREALNQRPGWDIDYMDSNGLLQRVEVKSTIAAGFKSITLTANELNAAREHGTQYSLILVAMCGTSKPKGERRIRTRDSGKDA